MSGGFTFDSFFVGFYLSELADFKSIENDGNIKNLKYSGLILGYIHKPHKLFHPSFALKLADGILTDTNNIRDNFLLVSPKIDIKMNIIEQFAIGLGIEYRFTYGVELPEISNNDISNIGYSLSLRYSWN